MKYYTIMKRFLIIPFSLLLFVACDSKTDKVVAGLWFEVKESYFDLNGECKHSKEYDINDLKYDAKKIKIASISKNNGSMSFYEYGPSGWDENGTQYYTLKDDTLFLYRDENHIDGPHKIPFEILSKDRIVLREIANDEVFELSEVRYELVRLE